MPQYVKRGLALYKKEPRVMQKGAPQSYRGVPIEGTRRPYLGKTRLESLHQEARF